MGKWPHVYKKDGTFNNTGQVSGPIDKKTGGAETETMFGAVLEVAAANRVDMSSISTTWSSTSWCFGMNTDYIDGSLTPSQA